MDGHVSYFDQPYNQGLCCGIDAGGFHAGSDRFEEVVSRLENLVPSICKPWPCGARNTLWG